MEAALSLSKPRHGFPKAEAAALREAFVRDGAVVIRGLLNDAWIGQLQQRFATMQAAAYDLSAQYDDPAKGTKTAKKGETLVRDDNWVVDEVMRDFIFKSPIGEACAWVMNSATARIYEDLLIYKGPGGEAKTPWHQDSSQWPMTGDQICSIWMCLDPVTEKTGALRFAAGSHKGPHYIPHTTPAWTEARARDMHLFAGSEIPDVDADPRRFPVISFDTLPGDVVIFHPRALHGSFGGSSDHARRTFSIRFMGDDVRWLNRHLVFHDWLRQIKLNDGDKMEHERFPIVWAAAEQ